VKTIIWSEKTESNQPVRFSGEGLREMALDENDVRAEDI
jgi:hypothetical protein